MLKKEHEVTGEIERAVPIIATYELSESEMADVASRFGARVLVSPTFTASRSYADPDVLSVEAEIDYKAFVDSFVSSLPDRVVKALDEGIDTSQKLIAGLRRLTEQKGNEDADIDAAATDASEALQRLWGITGAEGRNRPGSSRGGGGLGLRAVQCRTRGHLQPAHTPSQGPLAPERPPKGVTRS
jgi:hypothetical protein